MTSCEPNDASVAQARNRHATWPVIVALSIGLTVVACAGESAAGDAAANRTARIAAIDSARGATRDSVARVRQDSINRAQPGYVVDSVLPVEEEIRRFQNTLGSRPTGLGGGMTTRDALVGAFIDALERNDQQALRRLVVDRAEFGFLVYPTSPNTRPPYRLSPDIVWLQRSAGTEKALTRLLQRFGGRTSGFLGYTCEEASARQGPNRLWGECVVRLRNPAGDSARLRLFGPIIEREGTYKFLSLSSGL